MPDLTATLDQLRELLAAQPFRPYRLTLRDGREFRIDRMFSRDITEAGFVRLAAYPAVRIDPADIAAVEPAAESGERFCGLPVGSQSLGAPTIRSPLPIAAVEPAAGKDGE